MKKVILFGGTFDPIHNGHLQIAKSAKEQLKADEVIFILSKSPRWKIPNVKVEQRLEMLKLAIADIDGFTYSTYEIDNNSDFDLSVDTAKHFVSIAHENGEAIKYYWLIGKDQVAQLDRWAQIDELASIVQFVYYSRVVEKSAKDNIKKYHLMHIHGDLLNVSSTEVRKIESSNLPDQVFDYMIDNGLYFFGKMKELIDDKRLKHSISVARLAKRIALNNDLNADEAFYAGLFHDIAKNVTRQESKAMMEKYHTSYVDLPPWAYHQFNSVVLAKEVFHIENEEILEAISYHATGKSHLSPLGKVIYSADKIEPLRGFDSKELIDSCIKDYRDGFVKVLAANKDYLASKSNEPENRLTKECYDHYLLKIDN